MQQGLIAITVLCVSILKVRIRIWMGFGTILHRFIDLFLFSLPNTYSTSSSTFLMFLQRLSLLVCSKDILSIFMCGLLSNLEILCYFETLFLLDAQLYRKLANQCIVLELLLPQCLIKHSSFICIRGNFLDFEQVFRK